MAPYRYEARPSHHEKAAPANRSGFFLKPLLAGMFVGFRRVAVSLFAVLVRGRRVLSCFLMTALIVLVRCFVMMMSCRCMMLGGIQMVLG